VAEVDELATALAAAAEVWHQETSATPSTTTRTLPPRDGRELHSTSTSVAARSRDCAQAHFVGGS